MVRRGSLALILIITLAFLLTACGSTNQSEVELGFKPYQGAATLEVPTTFKSEMDVSLKNIKDGHYEAYKTGDELNKVKSYYADGFKKNGWEGKTTEITSKNKDITELPGSFAMVFQKGNEAAAIMGFSGEQAKGLGFGDVGTGDTFFLVLKGKR
jgi:major membrane immunogen (membrane-anchored lipoprotein)